MKKQVIAAIAAGSVLATASVSAFAHRVNLFAWVEGDSVHTEASFSGGAKARNAEIAVQDAATGKAWLTGHTNDSGAWSFKVPPEAIASGHDLKLVINAGEGHRNEWTVPASDLPKAKVQAKTPAPVAKASSPAAKASGEAAAPAEVSGPKARAAAAEASPKPAGTRHAPQPAAQSEPKAVAGACPKCPESITPEQLESIVDSAVEKRMAPVMRALAASQEKEPGIPEIVGGIGWVIGLFGIAAYFRSRKK